MSETAPTTADARKLAQEARDRVRFEEEALGLSDQVYRVARRLVGSRDGAEDLVQQTEALIDTARVDLASDEQHRRRTRVSRCQRCAGIEHAWPWHHHADARSTGRTPGSAN